MQLGEMSEASESFNVGTETRPPFLNISEMTRDPLPRNEAGGYTMLRNTLEESRLKLMQIEREIGIPGSNNSS